MGDLQDELSGTADGYGVDYWRNLAVITEQGRTAAIARATSLATEVERLKGAANEAVRLLDHSGLRSLGAVEMAVQALRAALSPSTDDQKGAGDMGSSASFEAAVEDSIAQRKRVRELEAVLHEVRRTLDSERPLGRQRERLVRLVNEAIGPAPDDQETEGDHG